MKTKNDVTPVYELAGFGRRLLAYIIDGFVISGATGISYAITGRSESFALSTLLTFLYLWYFWTQNDGQTPGKVIVGIRVIKANGEPMTAGDVVVRYIGYLVSSLFFMLGFLWALFDAHNQGWHDKLAGTYVVRASDRQKRKRR